MSFHCTLQRDQTEVAAEIYTVIFVMMSVRSTEIMIPKMTPKDDNNQRDRNNFVPLTTDLQARTQQQVRRRAVVLKASHIW